MKKQSIQQIAQSLTKIPSYDKITRFEAEYCCSNTPIYEISYNHIPRKWLVCNECIELEFFNTNIKEKMRIKKWL